MQSVPLWGGAAFRRRRAEGRRPSEVNPSRTGCAWAMRTTLGLAGFDWGLDGAGGPRRRGERRVHGGVGRRDRRIARHALDWWRPSRGRRGRFPRRWRGFRPSRKRCRTSLNVTGTEDISHRLTPPRRPFTVPGMQTPDQQFNSRVSGAIGRLRGRERALGAEDIRHRIEKSRGWAALRRQPARGRPKPGSPGRVSASRRPMRRVEPERPRLRQTGLSDAAKAGEPAYPRYNRGAGEGRPPLRTPTDPRSGGLRGRGRRPRSPRGGASRWLDAARSSPLSASRRTSPPTGGPRQRPPACPYRR